MPALITVGAGKEAELSAACSGSVTFLADTGTLTLDHASSFAGTVSGFAGQDAIDFRDIGFAANMILAYRASDANNGGTLTAGDGTHTANLALLGNYMASSFVALSDGHGGTLVTADSPSQPIIVAQSHA